MNNFSELHHIKSLGQDPASYFEKLGFFLPSHQAADQATSNGPQPCLMMMNMINPKSIQRWISCTEPILDQIVRVIDGITK